MKRSLSLCVAVIFFFTSVSSFAYNAECLNGKDKFSDCTVDIGDGNLTVKYKSKTWKELDKTISGNQITALSGGEFARRRVGASVATALLVSPLFLFMLFSKKKRDTFAIEYMKADGTKDNVLLQLKKEYGFMFGQELKTISQLDIVMQQSDEEKKAEEKALKKAAKKEAAQQSNGSAKAAAQLPPAPSAGVDEEPIKKKGNKYR